MGLFVGFAWHWFGLSAIKVSFAPTSGHTCQLLREFDSLRALKSELLGIAIAAGISNLYHPAADQEALERLSTNGVSRSASTTSFNIMKEFWPSIRRKLFGHQAGWLLSLCANFRLRWLQVLSIELRQTRSR